MRTDRKLFWGIFFISVIVAICGFIDTAYCQNYTVDLYVVDLGGGTSSSANYSLSYSVGQALETTTVSNTQYTTLAGLYIGPSISSPPPVPTIEPPQVVVPEPTTFSLLIVGLIGLCVCARKTMRKRTK